MGSDEGAWGGIVVTRTASGHDTKPPFVVPARRAVSVAAMVSARPRARWRRLRRVWIVLGATLAALLAGSSQAGAQSTHVFASSFTPAGECALSSPGGVAVNEATGDIYVADRGHERVVRLSHTGECLSHFKVKIPVAEEGAVENSGIAVDNNPTSPSFGDVYVVAAASEPEAINKYEAQAKETAGKVEGKVSAIKKGEEEEFGGVHGIAVDQQGKLYVYEEESVLTYDANAPKNKFLTGVELLSGCLEALSGFAVSPAGDAFYVAKELEARGESCVEPSRVIAKYSSSGEVLKRGLQSQRSTAAAVDLLGGNAGDVYVQSGKTVSAFTPTGALIERFGDEAGHELQEGAGLAVDSKTREVIVADAQSGSINVYEEPEEKPAVDSLTAQEVAGDPTSFKLSAQLDPKGSDTHYYFQYGTADCAATPALCTDLPLPPGQLLAAGFGDQAVSVQVSGLKAGTDYFYRLIASNSEGTSESQSATFQTLPTPAYLPDGRGWELVSPAEKGGGSVEPITSEGGLIQAAAGGGALAFIANAPFGFGVEGNRALEPNQIVSTRTGEGWASRDIVTPNERGEGFRGGAQREYQGFSPDLSLALVEPQPPFEALEHPLLSPQATERTIYRRNAAGCAIGFDSCFEPFVSASSVTAEPGGEKTKFGGKLTLMGFSSDLGHAVFESKVPLTASATTLPSEENLYEWSAGQAAAQQLQLVSVLPSGQPAPEALLGSLGKGVRGAVSDDGSRVFWTGLLENEAHELITHLFMRDTQLGETVQIDAAQGVKEQPEEELEPEEQEFQLASGDGQRVFFTYPFALTTTSTLPKEAVFLEEGDDLYACELPQAASKCTLTDLTVGRFGESADVLGVLGASEDGSYVYFVANGVLGDGASAGANPGSCKGEFQAGEACNLYFAHYDQGAHQWQEPHFIATLSGEDEHDWLAEDGGELARLSSRVSPNGRFLAFMSNRSLTGYDNRDANPAANEARDEEVFLYDAEDNRLVCPSCNPSGARPHGVLDTERSGEGLGLLVDRPETWGGQWLAASIPGWTAVGGVASGFASHYQSRYLTDEGRLFFNGADALIPQELSSAPLQRTRAEQVEGEETQVGVENVYQYEPQGVGGCEKEGCVGLISSGTSGHESAFLDASEDGDDVYFITAERLVATDLDTNYDVYDARVCSASSPCLTYEVSKTTPCEGLSGANSCRSGETTHESPPPAPSSTFKGPGNSTTTQIVPSEKVLPKKTVKLTRAQKLKRALAACRKKHDKHKRAACERQARKKYGAKHKRATAKKGAHR
jgi:DNA-binding beta-propeller fold protein YncE